jgi:hypothetical protein
VRDARPGRWLPAIALVVTAGAAACSGGGGSGEPEAFCELADDRQRFDDVFADLDPADVDEALEAFHRAREVEDELQAAAPEAVQADVGVMIRFLDDLIAGLQSPEATAGGRPRVYEQLRPRFDQVEAASERIELYVSTNC